MDFIKRVFFRAILPPLICLTTGSSILITYPNMSGEAFLVMLLVVYTLCQIPLLDLDDEGVN